MESSKMQISVIRGDDGKPRFRYPKEWNYEQFIEQLAELCCTLQEELEIQKTVSSVLRHLYDNK